MAWTPTAAALLAHGGAGRPDAPAVVQQAAPGAGHAARRPRTSRPSCSPSPAPPTPARSSTSTACAGSSPAPAWTSPRCRPPPTSRSTTTSARRWSGRAAAAPRLQMNCSGKHAAMLATCVAHGWPPRPTSSRITRCSRRSRRRSPSSPASPSRTSRSTAAAHRCSARQPAWASPARSRPWRPAPSPGCSQVARRSGSTRRTCRGPPATSAGLLRRCPGAIAKAGAESCYARRPGRRARVRHQDRRRRAAGPARRDGGPAGPARGGHRARRGHRRRPRAPARHPLLGGGRPVGEIRATL